MKRKNGVNPYSDLYRAPSKPEQDSVHGELRKRGPHHASRPTGGRPRSSTSLYETQHPRLYSRKTAQSQRRRRETEARYLFCASSLELGQQIIRSNIIGVGPKQRMSRRQGLEFWESYIPIGNLGDNFGDKSQDNTQDNAQHNAQYKTQNNPADNAPCSRVEPSLPENLEWKLRVSEATFSIAEDAPENQPGDVTWKGTGVDVCPGAQTAYQPRTPMEPCFDRDRRLAGSLGDHSFRCHATLIPAAGHVKQNERIERYRQFRRVNCVLAFHVKTVSPRRKVAEKKTR